MVKVAASSCLPSAGFEEEPSSERLLFCSSQVKIEQMRLRDLPCQSRKEDDISVRIYCTMSYRYSSRTVPVGLSKMPIFLSSTHRKTSRIRSIWIL